MTLRNGENNKKATMEVANQIPPVLVVVQLIHRLLTHQDLMEYFELYRDKRLQTVTEDGFKRFLMDIQKVPPHLIESQVEQMRGLEEPFVKEVAIGRFAFFSDRSKVDTMLTHLPGCASRMD